MNFVRYDPATGDVTSAGYMPVEQVQAEIDAGLPTLLLTGNDYFAFDKKRVNLATHVLEDIIP